MAKNDDYDHYHDYYNRGYYKNANPTGLVAIGVVYLLFQLVCWLYGQFWFWTILLPPIIITPVCTWRKTHDKNKTFTYGMIAVFFAVLIGMLCVEFLS